MKRNTILILAAVIVIAGAIALALANKDSAPKTEGEMTHKSTSQSTSPAASAVETKSVDITDFSFSPANIKVKVGDTVSWTNQDSAKHSVSADTTSSDAPDGPLFGKGETYTFTFKKAGTYAYHCSAHPSMHGTVIVE